MKRHSYHHGDLANALTEAAIELARAGGPEAIVLREAARQVGVSATAAYRHFAGHGDLMHAVKERSAVQLAERMMAELARTPPAADARGEAERRMWAFGQGYLRFALEEPGLFRAAFCRPDSKSGLPQPPPDLGHIRPYQMLVEAIDDLVNVGIMAPSMRSWAEFFAWSSVHGLAMLLLDGPLAKCTPEEREQIIERVLAGVRHGLTAR